MTFSVWMSHGDHVMMPLRISSDGRTDNALARSRTSKEEYGLQFHPEVAHTPDGKKILGIS